MQQRTQAVMFFSIDFIREEGAKVHVVRTVTDVSVSQLTARRRAQALFPNFRRRGATAVRIRNAAGQEIYRWRPQAPRRNSGLAR